MPAQEVNVIDDAAVAAAALDPLRNQILGQLVEPGSASTVADALGITRQKANYHLGILSNVGLVELVEERPRRGLTERIMVTSARSYLLSPDVLGPVAATPEADREGVGADRLSARYLLAVAGRIIREVAQLSRRADNAEASLSTLTLDTQIRFASADERAAFTADLANNIGALVRRYHNDSAPDGRWHRLVVAAHPTPPASRPGSEEPVASATTFHEGEDDEPSRPITSGEPIRPFHRT